MLSKNFLLVGLLVLTVIVFLASLMIHWISADAPYYITLARDLSQGMVSYKDVQNSYTPLVMYINSLVFRVFTNPDYSYFLIVQYVLILLDAFILYLLLTRRYNLERQLSLIITTSFIIAVFSSDGNYIILEPWVLLFALIGMYLFHSQSMGYIFLSGIFFGLAFFAKQYGILFLIPYVFYTLYQKDVKKFIILCSGALLTLLIFIGYFSGLQSVPLPDLISQISGQSYVSYSVEKPFSFVGFLIGGKIFFLYAAVLIVAIGLNHFKVGKYAYLLGGGLLLLMTTLIQSFQHYFILAFPFLFILLALSMSQQRTVLFTNVLFYCAILSVALLLLRLQNYHTVKEEQFEVAQKVEEMIPRNSSVFIKGHQRYLYILNDYRNPIVEEVGYNFIPPPDSIIARFITEDIQVLAEVQKSNSMNSVKFNGREIIQYTIKNAE